MYRFFAGRLVSESHETNSFAALDEDFRKDGDSVFLSRFHATVDVLVQVSSR